MQPMNLHETINVLLQQCFVQKPEWTFTLNFFFSFYSIFSLMKVIQMVSVKHFVLVAIFPLET